MDDPAPATPPDAHRTPPIGLAIALFAAFLATRLAFARWEYFWEQDDISIAGGIAGLVRGEAGGLYRYGPQVGYYGLVRALTLLLGGDPANVPLLMIGLSALAGAVIPTAALWAFPSQLAYRTRLLLAALVFANPILWMSSQYGNTGIVATAVVTSAIVVLSNRPARAAEAVALCLFAASILIRADSILLTPVIALLIHRSHGSIRAVLGRAACVGAGLAAVYGALLLFDPRMDDLHSTTSAHLFNAQFRTMFWTYLLWATSPLVLILASWGWLRLLERRDGLLIDLTLWCLPVFAFYFGSTTTPRYFLLTVFPLCICSSIGAVHLAQTLMHWTPRRRGAWSIVFAFCFAHLFVGFGRFIPDRMRNVVNNAQLFTHDGPHYTGGFLYHGLRNAMTTVRSDGFGADHPFAIAMDTTLREMAAAESPTRDIVFVGDGYPSVAFQYHADVAGAELVSRTPGPDDNVAAWYRIGDVRIMIVGDVPWALDLIEEFEVRAGDGLWNLLDEVPSDTRANFPATLDVEPEEGPGGPIHAYRFVAREADEER